MKAVAERAPWLRHVSCARARGRPRRPPGIDPKAGRGSIFAEPYSRSPVVVFGGPFLGEDMAKLIEELVLLICVGGFLAGIVLSSAVLLK